VGDGPQVFKGVPLFLQWVLGGIRPTQHVNLPGLKLDALALAGRGCQGPYGSYGTTRLQLAYFLMVIGQLLIGYNLQATKAGAVIDFNERKAAFRVSSRPDPAHDGIGRTDLFRRKDVNDRGSSQNISPL
jgi:hypothetical protein